ncbi:hypothetical protein AB0F17_18300 [Nonomuraea sp. NPDC026600]|uniref:hypothetical protein n=1 Tax=Nonomuraea sp. NPDC026600 TaxID=3155363 RepID=UPI0033DBE2F8
MASPRMDAASAVTALSHSSSAARRESAAGRSRAWAHRVSTRSRKNRLQQRLAGGKVPAHGGGRPARPEYARALGIPLTTFEEWAHEHLRAAA